MPKRTNENAGRDRVFRYGTWGAILLCMAGLFLGGCMVSKSKYETAVTEMEAAKAELEKSRTRYASLKQENDKLRDDHQQASLDLEMLSAEIRQIKEGQQSERDLIATREAELQMDREAMTSKLRAVQRAHQQLKSQNRALRDTVRRYEQELKEARAAVARSAAQASSASKKTGTENPPLASKTSTFKPASPLPPVAVPLNETATPVNINTASADDLELFLGLTKEEADKVVLNRPYRLRGELVSKKVVPKATFDVIKDRITAAPE